MSKRVVPQNRLECEVLWKDYVMVGTIIRNCHCAVVVFRESSPVMRNSTSTIYNEFCDHCYTWCQHISLVKHTHDILCWTHAQGQCPRSAICRYVLYFITEKPAYTHLSSICTVQWKLAYIIEKHRVNATNELSIRRKYAFRESFRKPSLASHIIYTCVPHVQIHQPTNRNSTKLPNTPR
jgi:hypothetical protein